MNDNFYQQLLDQLLVFCPKKWARILFYARYSTKGNYSMKFFIEYKKGKFEDCYAGKVDKLRIVKAFIDINKLLSPIREDLSKKDKWSVMTFIIDNKGNFNVDYDYTNYDDEPITWEDAWRKKYLK